MRLNFDLILAVAGTIAMNDYLEAATIVFLFSTAEWLESRASHKVSPLLHNVFQNKDNHIMIESIFFFKKT